MIRRQVFRFLFVESNWAAIEEEQVDIDDGRSPPPQQHPSSAIIIPSGPSINVVFVIGNTAVLDDATYLPCKQRVISGGPGSGKVSHSQRLSQELRNGILHLNVTELLKDIYRLNGKLLE